ncbi:MAG: hypothetical protein E7293_11495 [Lachnospiraceae bacterium]|nr:hypothetical protein [Lachnospiraceae bacterium]
MRESRFECVVVIGCGKIAVTAIKYIASLRENYRFALRFMQHEIQEMTAIRKVCVENYIDFISIPDKGAMTEALMQLQGNTLIVSAGNYYLFPKELLEKQNITVINFHNALLPKYPGRNAPSWAIYYDEKQSGATWHLVSVEVDAGEIIWQKACRILPDMKAYELTARIMELAQEGLEEFFEMLLQGQILTRKQEKSDNRRMFYAKEIPARGRLKMTDDPAYIYRVLRALDYGKMGPFPATLLELDKEHLVEVQRYKKVCVRAQEQQEGVKNLIEITLDEDSMLQIKYKEKEN